MRSRDKGTPYIRKIRRSDKGISESTEYAMTLYKYGVFRRGYPGLCILAALSKKGVKDLFIPRKWRKIKKIFKMMELTCS